MSDGTNREQIEYWNGPTGARWVDEQELRDRELLAYGEAALRAAAVKPGESLVDVGCGCGATTLALGSAVGSQGRVLGLDVSAPMLARAQARTAALPQVTYVCADATTYAFERRATLLYSRFGVMFFDDPFAAFTNLARALLPGGRLAFVCWRGLRENDWLGVPFAAASKVVTPTRPPQRPNAPGPLAFADPGYVRDFLSKSGFVDVDLAPFDHRMRLGDDRGLEAAAAEAVTLGPTARLLADADDVTRVRALDAVREALRPHAQGADVQLSAATWIVRARLP